MKRDDSRKLNQTYVLRKPKLIILVGLSKCSTRAYSNYDKETYENNLNQN